MSLHSTEIFVHARHADLPCLMDEVARLAEAQGMAEATVRRLQLLVEELFTNTIAHGLVGGTEALVRISLLGNGDHLTLRYIDDAPPFDYGRAPDTNLPDAAIGGFGIALIRGISRAVRYQRLGALNVTELDL